MKKPNNERNAGRKKHIGKRYVVICHPNAIGRVREIIIQESLIEHEKEKANQK